MTTIDYARLRELAEKARPDGEHGTYTFEGTRRLREFQYEVSPQTVLALLDEIERQRHYMGLLSQENKELLEENMRLEIDHD